MKLIRQNPEELNCLLVSVCMLENLDYDYYKQFYPDITKKEDLALDFIKCLAPYLDLKPVLEVNYQRASELDLSGMGLLSIGIKNTWGHSVAYENGKIYDPDNGIFDREGFTNHYKHFDIIENIKKP